MHRIALISATGLAAATLLVAPASAASATTTTIVKTTTTTTPHIVRHTRWRDIVGVFITEAAANHRMQQLTTKGRKGFTILTIHTRNQPNRFEVEGTFTTHAAALTEATTVRRDGFSVRVIRIVI